MYRRKGPRDQQQFAAPTRLARCLGWEVVVCHGFRQLHPITRSTFDFFCFFIDLLMGLFRGAVFHHGGGALKQPIKQPTETPTTATSTLALMGRFPSLMGRFPTLMGRFTDFVLRGRFTS